MTTSQTSGGRLLRFSGGLVEATLLHAPDRHHLDEGACVINPAAGYVEVSGDPGHGIPPLCSRRLRKTHISSEQPVIVVRVAGQRSASAIREEAGWQRFSPATASSLPIPELWHSEQDEVATLDFPPSSLLPLHIGDTLGTGITFVLRLNLWFATAGTHCLIHNRHDFMEIHTQISGIGYMQKFRSPDFDSLYEQVGLLPATTTSQPFCVTNGRGGFEYPWHQYYAETDCIWMALEYHPLS